jgi:hypothetical protein
VEPPLDAGGEGVKQLNQIQHFQQAAVLAGLEEHGGAAGALRF